jgi:hypothetical protein
MYVYTDIRITFKVSFGKPRGKVTIPGRRVADIVLGIRRAGCEDLS